MSINVAKLLVTVGADTDDLEKGLNDSNSGVNRFVGNSKTGLEKVGMAFTAAGVVAAGFAVAWGKAMELGREGAELEYAAQKFDRLTAAVGTVSDALMNDLRAATKGTMSDARLMASAGDLMALGLAKTHDQVVRLTRVSSGLNMDMNQLVLTLSSQSTMRFDQLGVSVDGFQEKVDKLKAKGMSASDAFAEAFLQQAEQQLETVGDSADTSVGAFKRLEAAAQNLGDTLKLKLTPFLADAANGMADFLGGENDTSRLVDDLKEQERVIRQSTKSYDEYLETLMVTGEMAGILDESFRKLFHESMDSGNVDRVRMAFETLTSQLGAVDEITWSATQGMEAYEGVFDKFANDIRGLPKTEINLINAAVEQANLDNLTNSAQGAMGQMDALLGKVEELDGKMRSWLESTGNQAAQIMGQYVWEGADIYDEYLGIIDEIFGTDNLAEKQLTEKLENVFKNAAGDPDKVRAELEKIAKEGVASITKELNDAAIDAQELYEKLYALPEEIRIKIGFDVEDLPDWIDNVPTGDSGSGDQKNEAVGGPVWPGQSYIVGERGYEIFSPSSPGYVYPNSDAGRGGGAGVSLTNYGNIFTGPDDPFGSQLLAVLV